MSSRQMQLMQALQNRYPGYHPLISIAEIAHTSEDLKLQFECHKTIAKYIEPELKSVEVVTETREATRVVVSLFEDDITDADYEELDKPQTLQLQPITVNDEDIAW